MTDPLELIHNYYRNQPELEKTLLEHSRMVATRALDIVKGHPEWRVDPEFVYEADMLHDIGILYTDAPGIHCRGTRPYLSHGILGGNILRHQGLVRHARVAERHTGTGLTAQQIAQRGLPLPQVDLIPLSLEEQVVCYADKFYSKSRPGVEKTCQQVEQSLAKFGPQGVAIFKRWSQMFEQNSR